MSNGIAVEVTIRCVVGDLHEAEDALKAARRACERNGWPVTEAWLRAMWNKERSGAHGAEVGRA